MIINYIILALSIILSAVYIVLKVIDFIMARKLDKEIDDFVRYMYENRDANEKEDN